MPIFRPLLALALTFTVARAAAQTAPPDTLQKPPASARYRDARNSPAHRAQDLLSRMTLDEKFWQLFMIPGDRDNPAHDYRHGSFGLQINVPAGMRAEAPRSDTLPSASVARARTPNASTRCSAGS